MSMPTNITKARLLQAKIVPGDMAKRRACPKSIDAVASANGTFDMAAWKCSCACG
jgi:hypothetical protein